MPPILGFSSRGWKDNVANAEATGEFVWNLVSREQVEVMNATSATVGPEVDEFELAGIATASSRLVAPPRVVGSPVQFECRVTQIIQLKNAKGDELPQWLVLGEAVAIHIDQAMIENGVYETARARPIMRAGGPDGYFEVTPDGHFRMARPNDLRRASDQTAP